MVNNEPNESIVNNGLKEYMFNNELNESVINRLLEKFDSILHNYAKHNLLKTIQY